MLNNAMAPTEIVSGPLGPALPEQRASDLEGIVSLRVRELFEDIAPDTLSEYLVGFKFDTKYSFRKYSIDDRFTYFWGNQNELEMGVGYDFMTTYINFDFDIDKSLMNFFNSNSNIRAVFEDIDDRIDYKRLRAYVNNLK